MASISTDSRLCRNDAFAELNDFGNRWCKRESVECNTLKEWKLRILDIVNKRISFFFT